MPGHQVANSCCTPGPCPAILMTATRSVPSSKPQRGSPAARSSAPMSIRDTAATTPQTRGASSSQAKSAGSSAALNASSDGAPARMLGFRSTENSGKPYHDSRFGEGRHFKPPGLSHFPSVAFGMESWWPLLVSDASCALHRLLLERTNFDSSRLPLLRNFKASQQQQHPHVVQPVERCFRKIVQNSG